MTDEIDKKQTVAIDYKKLIKTEYTRCAKDPCYFIKKYCVIQNQELGRIPFALYPYQENTIKTILEKDSTIVLKGRQVGISTTIACFSLWYMLFNKDKNILVVATKQDTAKNLITKVKYAFDALPIWLQVPTTEYNKLTIKFSNNSQIKAVSSTSEGTRSESASILILDEAAWIPGVEDLWQSAQSTLSASKGKAVLISTPAGAQGFFYKKYREAEEYKNKNKEGAFYPVKLDWTVHPNRDTQWKDRQLATMSKRDFAQEHEAEFLASGNMVFESDSIQHQITNNVKEPPFKMGPGGDFWIWEQPDYSISYVVSADVSRGEQSDDGDFSAVHVMDIKNCVQVAEYKGRIGTENFGNMLVGIATQYNDAVLVVDNSGVGWATIQAILNRGYKNLFYMSNDMKYLDAEELDLNKVHSQERSAIAGFTMSSRTRPLVIAKLDQYLRDNAVTIKSQRTIDEMNAFVWHNAKAQAAEGEHDDLIMSLGQALWIRDTALKLHQLDIQYTKLALDKIQRSNNWESIYTTNRPAHDPFSMPIGNGQNHDFRWVL